MNDLKPLNKTDKKKTVIVISSDAGFAGTYRLLSPCMNIHIIHTATQHGHLQRLQESVTAKNAHYICDLISYNTEILRIRKKEIANIARFMNERDGEQTVRIHGWGNVPIRLLISNPQFKYLVENPGAEGKLCNLDCPHDPNKCKYVHFLDEVGCVGMQVLVDGNEEKCETLVANLGLNNLLKSKDPTAQGTFAKKEKDVLTYFHVKISIVAVT